MCYTERERKKEKRNATLLCAPALKLTIAGYGLQVTDVCTTSGAKYARDSPANQKTLPST